MVRQAVQQGGRHPLALEDLCPLAEGQVASDQQAASFVAVGKDLEQQFSARAAEREITEFVADQQIALVEPGQKTIEPVLLLRFLQASDQRGCGEEPHAATLSTGCQAQCGGSMRFPSSGTADQTNVLVAIDPLAARQFQDLLFGQ